MSAIVLIADDAGPCYADFAKILKGTELKLTLVRSPEECLEVIPGLKPHIVVVYAAMSRAFSLMRSLRQMAETMERPLLVVGEADQEELLSRHRSLPSRADRYLVRPLEEEEVRQAMYDLLGGSLVETNAGPAQPQVQDPAPSAYDRLADELASYKSQVAQLQKDLEVASKAARELNTVREENQSLKVRMLEQDAAGAHVSSDLFQRLELGYKETIEDLERLIQEKDSLLAGMRAAGADAKRAPAEASALQAQITDMKRAFRLIRSALTDLELAENDLDLFAISDFLNRDDSDIEEEDTGFGIEDKTVVVSGKDLRK